MNFFSLDCSAPFTIGFVTDTTSDGADKKDAADAACLAQRGMLHTNYRYLIKKPKCLQFNPIFPIIVRTNYESKHFFAGVCLQYQQIACGN